MPHDDSTDRVNVPALERELRAIPGIVSCAVAGDRVSVLLDPDANQAAVKRAAAAVAQRYGMGAPDLLVPASARAQRWRIPRAPIVVAGASVAVLGSLLPLATKSLPRTPPVVLHAAPPAPATPPVVLSHSSGTAPASPPSRLTVPPPLPGIEPLVFFPQAGTTAVVRTVVKTVVKTVVEPVPVPVPVPGDLDEEEDEFAHVHHVPHTPNKHGHVPEGRAVGWWGK
jgi:hypothetical protein